MRNAARESYRLKEFGGEIEMSQNTKKSDNVVVNALIVTSEVIMQEIVRPEEK